jgi:hypothetical protein
VKTTSAARSLSSQLAVSAALSLGLLAGLLPAVRPQLASAAILAALLFCYTGVAAQSLAPPAYDPAIALKSALPADAESATSVCSAGTTITLILPTNQWGTVQSCGMCVQCAALLPACMPQRAAGSVHATRLPCHSRALPAFRRPGALLNFKRTPHALSGGQPRATSTRPPRRYAPSRPSVPAPQWLVTFFASRVSAYCFVSVAGLT